MSDHDAERNLDRLALLDRIEERVPDLDLDQHTVEWVAMPDGAPGLAVDGGGFRDEGDGANGFTFANAGDDLHAVGPTAPLLPGYVGCIVFAPDGSRRLAQVMPDPLAQPEYVHDSLKSPAERTLECSRTPPAATRPWCVPLAPAGGRR